MNTPNPLIPQGSLERQSRGKSTVRIAIFTIVSIHAVFFAGLLMQGCRRDDKAGLQSADAGTNQNTLPPIDAGYYPSTQEVAQSSSSVPSAAAPANTVTEAPATLPAPAAITELPADTKSYTVVKGDTLAKIARAHKTTVGAISKANPSIDASKLHAGQKLQIPAAATSTAAAAPASASPGIGFAEPGKSEAPTGSGNVHAVKAGETLTRIAKQHGTTVKAIRAINNLKSDRVYVGQKLKLPASQAAARAGDSHKSSNVSQLTATNPSHVNPIQ